jgi:hypothetical protein
MTAGSARGLFAATGNKAKPISVTVGEDLGGAFERPEFNEREKDEFYPTPPEPTRAIIAAEFEHLRCYDLIWEPACGDGAMTTELQRAGLNTFSSDIIQHGAAEDIEDFYAFRSPPSKCVVTNPPFAECTKDPGWIRHGMGVLGLEYMALLMPLNFMGASTRGQLWIDHPPARIYVMRWRIDWTGQGAPPMICAWYVYDIEHQGEIALRFLDRPTDARQGEMF